MFKTISNLPNQFNPFALKDFAIYVLEDYAAHLMSEIRKALYQRGYMRVLMEAQPDLYRQTTPILTITSKVAIETRKWH